MSGTVVLCGSLGTSSEVWAPQLPALDGYRIVTVDHPGHGGAPVTDARTVGDLAALVLEQAGDEPFSFVGLSLGGAIGMQLALAAPDRVEKLVLACTSPRFGEPEPWLERAALVREHGLETIVDTIMARWFTPAFDDVSRFRAMFLSTDPEGYARCCVALSQFDVRDALGMIAAPTLVVAGSDDPVSPPETGAEIAAGIPGARLEIVDNAAHLASVERPDEFNRLLKEHL